MHFIEFCFVLASAIQLSLAFDPFVGFLEQGKPCFETIEVEDCSLSLPQVFTPKFKGTNTNVPRTDFWLFTSKNKDKAEPLHKCGGKLPKNSAFNSTQDTIIIIQGIFESLCRVAWQREFKEQLFLRGDYNVILVDWTFGNLFDVIGGVLNAYVVGEQTGFLIKNIMIQNNYKNGLKFYVIGHSAGAYAANGAGRFIREWKPSHKLRRITLLDPGEVRLFNFSDLRYNTSYKEAHFVDVMHTGSGYCFPPELGLAFASGHADFYPNGGFFQLSCYPEVVSAFSKGDFLYALGSLVFPTVCSHLQATQFFKVSINHPAGLQIGAMCDSYDDFLSGKCKRCCKPATSSPNCAVAGFDAEKFFPYLNKTRRERKYYYNLGLVCPYNEDYTFSIYKDCK